MYKLIFSLLVFLLYSCTLFSDWEPFQLGRSNYYKLPDHYTFKFTDLFHPKYFSSIIEVTFDSIVFNKEIGKNQYFNRRLKSTDSKLNKCNLSYNSLLNLQTNEYNIKYDLIIGSTDTYLFEEDTMFFITTF